MHYTHVRDEAGVVETCTVVLAACGSACQLIERQLPRRSISWHALPQAASTTVHNSVVLWNHPMQARPVAVPPRQIEVHTKAQLAGAVFCAPPWPGRVAAAREGVGG